MQRILETFNLALTRVKQVGGLHAAVTSLTTSAVDPSDLLRSQVVLAVSALDYLVHEITVWGMLEIYDGVRQPTGAYGKFHIPLGSIGQDTTVQLSRTDLEAVIRDKHSYLSFQRPDKIADAIRLFSPVLLWESIAIYCGDDTANLKAHLNLVVDRRNKIAHEADLDPSYPGVRWPISVTDVDGVVKLIRRVGHGICHAVQ